MGPTMRTRSDLHAIARRVMRARGLEPRVLPLPGLGLDVDAPEDLAALLDMPGATVSARLVASWRAGGRLRPAGIPRAS